MVTLWSHSGLTLVSLCGRELTSDVKLKRFSRYFCTHLTPRRNAKTRSAEEEKEVIVVRRNSVYFLNSFCDVGLLLYALHLAVWLFAPSVPSCRRLNV